MKKIVFTGGGSAGHVTPNLAILNKLPKECKCYYIGSQNGIEKSIIKNQTNLPYYEIECAKLIRKITLKNLLIPFKLLKGINESKKILKELKPDVVFSKGGFVSVPVAIACKKLNIPLVGHESDISIGLANKIILKNCSAMCFSFKEAMPKNNKCKFTGSPVRSIIFSGKKENVLNKHKNLISNKGNIFVFGGSLGAMAINNAVWESINTLCKNFNIIHIVGKGNIKPNIMTKNYVQLEFVNNIEDYFNWADLAISRAGSNAIFELLAISKPMLLIPLPKDVSRGDQVLNAESFMKNGFATVINQSELNSVSLISGVNNLYNNRYKYINNMKNNKFKNGTDEILKIIKECAKF